MAKLGDIPKFISGGGYKVDVSLSYLLTWLKPETQGSPVDFDPDFQRGHVWNDEQRIRYVEYVLRGGVSQKQFYWNHPTYQHSSEPQCDLAETLLLVDGKQRITSLVMFLENQLPVFGHLLKDFEDPMHAWRVHVQMSVNNLQTRREVLQWYLDLNDGGVVHTPEEIAKVRALLAQEKPA